MRTAPRLFRAAVLACVALMSSVSLADVTIDVNQVGNDVVATVSGSFLYNGISTFDPGTGNLPSFINPNAGNFGFSNTAGSIPYIGWSIYQDNFPPAYAAPFFGDNSSAGNGIYSANSTSGVGTLYLQANPGATAGANEARLRLPTAYTGGDPLNGTETWANKSYADLGLASSGTWSWTAENNQKVVFRINAVPEPALGAGGLIAAAAAAAYVRRRTAKA